MDKHSQNNIKCIRLNKRYTTVAGLQFYPLHSFSSVHIHICILWTIKRVDTNIKQIKFLDKYLILVELIVYKIKTDF